ncbi:MAG: hypothetical protein R6T83_09945 [Salinibacter sp.]
MSRPALFLLLFSVTGILAACATTATTDAMFNEGRRSYVQTNDLTEKDSVHVLEGRIYRGMPIDHALAALGPSAGQDTTTTDGGTRVEYMYRSRPNALDPGSVHRAYVYAEDRTVTDWKGLDKIPRFDAYYEGGM